MAAAGLMTWFTTLIIVVRFMPHRIGPTFFRLVNATFGLILLAFARLRRVLCKSPVPPFPRSVCGGLKKTATSQSRSKLKLVAMLSGGQGIPQLG